MRAQSESSLATSRSDQGGTQETGRRSYRTADEGIGMHSLRRQAGSRSVSTSSNFMRVREGRVRGAGS